MIGHAPRHLDRNIAVVGRVIEGIERLSALPRGTEALGFYKDESQHVPISSVRLASEIPPAERPAFQYMDTESATFGAYVKARANRKDDFFIRPAGGVDLCNVAVPVRRKPARLGRPGGVGDARFLCWMIAGPVCERMLASASGKAVEQKAHSADIRPMSQCVRPQPGQ